MTDYGLPFEENTDGPDRDAARRAYVESKLPTDEIDVILADSRRLVAELDGVGRRNHFVDKWKAIIRPSTKERPA